LSVKEATDPVGYRLRLWGRASFVALILVVGTIRAVAVFTESVNWDEFALLQRAEILASTGVMQGGGRPGLVNLLLAPLAENCRNAVTTLVQARHFWTVMVFASAVAFWLMLWRVLPASRTRWTAVATGLGLWVLAAHFLRFSVQVRTDQPAVLMGLWGGVALLASRRRPGWAAVAGVLFGIGFLASQKLLYVGGLVGIMTGGWHLIHGDFRWRRELVRAGLAGAAFVLVMLGFREAVSTVMSGAPPLLPVSGQMRVFDYYREYLGFRLYRQMLPLLLPQVIVVGLLAIVTFDWARARGRHGAELAVAWAVLAAGLFVVAFHAGRFPYFYIVLGLFPATIGALVTGPMLERLEGRRQELVLIGVLWVPLTFIALAQAVVMLMDDQRHQHESLAFVERNFPPEARGFEGQAAFTCRHDPEPFKTRFFMHVLADFQGEAGHAEVERMLGEFRARPVQYMIDPREHEPYPHPLREFWATRYVLYRSHVRIPGRELRGEPGREDELEIIVPGEYRWWADEGAARPLLVGADTVPAGGVVTLARRGVVRLALPEGGGGVFALSVAEPPAPDSTPFYRRF
jgi:hypothetical protein